jgi:hypothetical protein
LFSCDGRLLAFNLDAFGQKRRAAEGVATGHRRCAIPLKRVQAAAGLPIVCQEKDRERYGRVVVVRRATGEDLGAVMAREGLAWAFTRFSVDRSTSRNRLAPPTVAWTSMTACRHGNGGRSSEQSAVRNT